MANANPNTEAMVASRKNFSAEKTKAVEQAIRSLVKQHVPITVAAVAQEAGVSAPFIYQHPDLRARIEKLREIKRGIQAVPDKPSEDTVLNALRMKVRNMEQQHKNEIKALEALLADANKRIELLTAEIIILGK